MIHNLLFQCLLSHVHVSVCLLICATKHFPKLFFQNHAMIASLNCIRDVFSLVYMLLLELRTVWYLCTLWRCVLVDTTAIRNILSQFRDQDVQNYAKGKLNQKYDFNWYMPRPYFANIISCVIGTMQLRKCFYRARERWQTYIARYTLDRKTCKTVSYVLF